MLNESGFSLSRILVSLKEIEHELLQDDTKGSSASLDKLHDLQRETSKHATNLAHNPDISRQVYQAASRIHLIAGARLRLNQHFDTVHAKLVTEASRILKEGDAPGSNVAHHDLSENLPSYHMRKHFLETLDNPYPTQEEKETLVRLTNQSAASAKSRLDDQAPLEIHQLTLWFINARRRSGWSHILKKFAREDRSRMKLLVKTKMQSTPPSGHPSLTPSASLYTVDDLLSDNLGRPLTVADKKQFEDDWASMISWIKYGVKEKVGDWVYELAAANKKAPKPGQARTVTTAVKRSPARKTATATQAKPRKAKQRASTTPSIDSIADSSRLESTPELSMCSTADTSFSTLGSNVSMVQYDPFQYGDDLLQSPTLNAKGSRKVKALPKRAGKQLLPEAVYTDEKGFLSTSTCFPVPEENKPPPSHSAHTQVIDNGQTTSYLSTQLSAFPPFDTLGQVPMTIVRRDSFSSNSLSAAFG